ncbi:hypothetical protein ISCGN_031814 [Ixodes scapularis]
MERMTTVGHDVCSSIAMAFTPPGCVLPPLVVCLFLRFVNSTCFTLETVVEQRKKPLIEEYNALIIKDNGNGFWDLRLADLRNTGGTPVGEAASVDNWAWCLESVRELLLQAEAVFNKEASSQVCREALETEEGATYMRNMTEVYKVGQRIALSSRLTGMQSERLEQLCSEVQGIWERISSFLENSCLFTLEAPPVQDPKWLPDAESTAKACGVCLLHVDNPDIAPSKLSYSGREYHSPCANLWVNCVNSLLPAVTRPQLI